MTLKTAPGFFYCLFLIKAQLNLCEITYPASRELPRYVVSEQGSKVSILFLTDSYPVSIA